MRDHALPIRPLVALLAIAGLTSQSSAQANAAFAGIPDVTIDYYPVDGGHAMTVRRAIDAALTAGGPLDPLAPWQEDGFDRWLGGDGTGAIGFHRIRLRSADADDLTLRAARLLGQADRVYHRPDVPPAILDRARADAARIACAAPPAAAEGGLTLDLDWEKR